jgi:shikimate kinase
MMGSGKTTVGQILARRLGYPFLDTDALIETITQQSISTIFAQQGEAEFRKLETQVLGEVSAFGRLVIATGGGIVQRPQNWSYLHHGIVIWLDVSTDLLLQRLRHDPTPRPLLHTADPAATLDQLLKQRRPFYAQADVHVRVEHPASPEEVSEWVWQQVQRQLRVDA